MSAHSPLESLLPLDEHARVISRWGTSAEAGYQPLPDVLLFNQAELGLCSEDLNVLLQVTAHWYFPEKMPFPRPTTIARRMGVSARTVQRALTRLRNNGLIGKSINADGQKAIDLKPLVKRLQPLAERRLLDRGMIPGGSLL